MKRPGVLISAAVTLGILLAGCAPISTVESTSVETTESASLATAHGLAGMTANEIIEHLERMPISERPTDLIASVRTDSLVLSDGQVEESMALPADLSYVSIAPFVSQTHECYFHSLTTCRGELGNSEVDVRIIDNETGDVIVDETSTTFDNGFIGFWLPRDFDGTIDVTQGDLAGSTAISTAEDAATCVTTLQLA